MKIITALIMAMMATPVMASHSQGKCAPREIFVTQMADKYGELRVAVGLTGAGSLMEIFANSETGTWTVLVSSPGGLACLVSSGTNFETAFEPEKIGAPL